MNDNSTLYISLAHAVACRTLGIKHLRTRPRRPQAISLTHAVACRTLGIKHLRTRPPRPQAERFIRTVLDGWAYGSSRERRDALTAWLDLYDHRRPHGALSRHTPITRVTGNNLIGFYS